MKKITLVFIVVAAVFFKTTYGQSNITTVTQQINSINNAYQNASFLMFDMDVILTSDTINSYYENDKELVHYVLNGNSFYYATEEAEFMQDDTFSITAFNKEQMLIVAKQERNIKTLLPLRTFNDTSLQYYFQYYNVSTATLADGDKQIEFITDSAWAFYKQIRIKYDPDNYLLSEVEFRYNDEATAKLDENNDGVVVNETLPLLAKKLFIQCRNYQFTTNGKALTYQNYIYYDRLKKEYTGSGKYKGYRVLTSNVSNSLNTDEDVETPASTGTIKY
jgi:hypothetical protein